MPTYDFRCPNGHTFERFLRMSNAPMVLPCPECGTEAERRISGGAGLSFKGSGFYLTDYGKNAHRAPGGESKSGGSEKGGGDKGGSESGSSESKPTTGSESKSEVRTEKSESKPAAPAPESKPSKPSSSE